MRIAIVLFSIICFTGCKTSQKAAVNQSPKTETAQVSKEVGDPDKVVKAEEPNIRKGFDQLIGKWKIVSIKPDKDQAPVPFNNGYFEFRSDNTMSGSGGCNSFSGSFKLIGNNIRFRDITSTQMKCDKMEQEYMLMKYLGYISALQVNNKDEIYLKDSGPDGVILCRRM